MRIKSGVNTPETDQAAHHQSGASQQDEGQRYFSDYENALSAMPRTARAAAEFGQPLQPSSMDLLTATDQADR